MSEGEAKGASWKKYKQYCSEVKHLLEQYYFLRTINREDKSLIKSFFVKIRETSVPSEISAIRKTIKDFSLSCWSAWKGRITYRDLYIKSPDEGHQFQITLLRRLYDNSRLVLKILAPLKENKEISSSSSSFESLKEEEENNQEEIPLSPPLSLSEGDYDWSTCNITNKGKKEKLNDIDYFKFITKQKQLESLNYFIKQSLLGRLIIEELASFIRRILRKTNLKNTEEIGKFAKYFLLSQVKKCQISSTLKTKLIKAIEESSNATEQTLAFSITEKAYLTIHELNKFLIEFDSIASVTLGEINIKDPLPYAENLISNLMYQAVCGAYVLLINDTKIVDPKILFPEVKKIYLDQLVEATASSRKNLEKIAQKGFEDIEIDWNFKEVKLEEIVLFFKAFKAHLSEGDLNLSATIVSLICDIKLS